MPLLPSVERADGQVIDQEALARRRRRLPARKDTRMCQTCTKRPAVISETGETEDEGTHTLCFQCFRQRATHARPAQTTNVEDRVELSGQPAASASVEDRDQLYTDLRLRLRRAQIAARHASEEQPAGAAPAAEPESLQKAS